MSNISTKSKKIVKKKRLAISFSKDDPIINIIEKLESAYYGMDMSSITKLAFIELLENKMQSKISANTRLMTKEEETFISNYINKPELLTENESLEYLNSLKKSVS